MMFIINFQFTSQISQQHLFKQHFSISAISQLVQNKFGPNFKCRFLDPFLPDARVAFVHISNNSSVTDPIFIKFFFELRFFGPKIFLDPEICWAQKFSNPNFFGHNFVRPKLFWTQSCWIKKLVGHNIFLNQKYF